MGNPFPSSLDLVTLHILKYWEEAEKRTFEYFSRFYSYYSKSASMYLSIVVAELAGFLALAVLFGEGTWHLILIVLG